MDLNQVVVFTEVARTGSFTRAAQALEMPKSTVSRKVAELEARLGTRLLQRTTRKLSLTEEGRRYFEHCTRVVAELQEAEQSLSAIGAAPHGLLRVTAPLAFGFAGSIIAGFLAKYPDVEVELVCTDRVVDLVDERFDVALRAGILSDSSLIARTLGVLPRVLVASPRYLAKHKAPRVPADLEKHACVVFGAHGRSQWRLTSGERSADVAVSGALASNDYDFLREAAIAGGGIALLPEPGCLHPLQERRLERVLPEWEGQPAPLHAVYPSTRHLSSRVKAFVEHLQAEFPRIRRK